MFFRRCEREDIPAIRKLLSYFSETQATDNQLWLCVSLFWHHKKYFIVQEDDDVVAVGSLVAESKLHHCPQTCYHIEDVVVDEKQRGRGAGRMLVQGLLDEIKVAGDAYRVKLRCEESKADFYGKFGFLPNGITMQKEIL